MSNQIVPVSSNNFLTPAVNVRVALEAYQSMKEFVSGVLREEVDYGKVPGSSKPSLLKPGAEKLTRFFGLAITLPEARAKRVEDWTGEQHGGEPFFYFSYTAQAWHGDRLIAECEGSVNSWEKKYRYRDQSRKCPKCGKETIIKGKDEYGGGWLCFAKKGGCGAKYQDEDPAIIGQVTGQIKNPDVFDLVNTIQKMAQKRAIVGVALLACNASEYFTQDIEDYVDGTFTQAKPEAKTEPKVAPAKPAKVVKPTDKTEEELIGELMGEPVRPTRTETPGMSYETAELVTDSNGHLYVTLETKELTGHINSLVKAIQANGLTIEERQEKLYKVSAIKCILQHRAQEAK